MTKKIILYIISILVFLFAFFELTSYVIGAPTPPKRDPTKVTIHEILRGWQQEIEIGPTRYNTSQEVFCVSNKGDSYNSFAQKVLYFVQFNQNKDNKISSIKYEYKKNGELKNKIDKGTAEDNTDVYQRFAYIIYMNQHSAKYEADSSRYLKYPPPEVPYDERMTVFSPAQLLIWRRIYKDVENQLVKDDLMEKNDKTGQELRNEEDFEAGVESSGITQDLALELWEDSASVTNIKYPKVNSFTFTGEVFGPYDDDDNSDIQYYYFPFKADFTGIVTQVADATGVGKAVYADYNNRDVKNNKVNINSIRKGVTYYLRWSMAEITSGVASSATITVAGSGHIYSFNLAIMEHISGSQNLILVDAEVRNPNPVQMTAIPPTAASLTINKKDRDTGGGLEAGFYIQYQDGRWLAQNGTLVGSPSEIKTDVNGTVTISNMLNFGTYKVYEFRAPTGYDLTQQDGYGADPAHPDWVYCNSTSVSLGIGSKVTWDILQDYYIKGIRGRVWEDRGDSTKNSSEAGYDYKYGNGDSDVDSNKKVIVELVHKNGTVKARTETTGAYSFEFYRDQDTKYWNLSNYYIRFTYDNRTYVTVPVLLNDAAGSKAIEKQIDNDDLFDSKLTGMSGANPGVAVTYSGYYNDESNGFKKYYNTGSHYVENINLGLMEKPPTEYTVSESIEYVKIVRGNYSFRYSYGDAAIVDDTKQNQATYLSTVNYQNQSGSFTQAIYPSDIAYNMSNDVTDEYQVYVVYRIDVKNNTTTNLSNLYVEQKLWLNSLTNSYESNKYELATNTNIANNLDYKSGDQNKNAINGNFDDWTDNGNGTASLKIGESAYKDGIGAGSTVSSYIQFKVTEETLEKIVTAKTNEDVEGIYEQASSNVDVNAYHTYNRNDSNWRDNTQKIYTHQTADLPKKASALFIKFTLKDTRTISGKVFEDKQTAESSDANTRVGNGYMDNTGENTLKDVIVTLLNINDDGSIGSIAHTYPITDNFLKQNAATGKWECIPNNAIVNVADNGTYSIPDVIPGEYILQFTYGDGSTSFTDTNGNPITIATKIGENKIRSNYYKSTILTGAAARATEDNKDVWFMNDIGKTNSIAIDATATYYYGDGSSEYKENIIDDRTSSNREIYNESSETTIVINAQSPNMDIQFEYLNSKDRVVEHNAAGNLATNLTGMYFGIIERPHIKMDLEENISNVALILSNGTQIINGDPNQNISASLAVLDENASYVKIETDPTYLYGSTAEVTYRLKVINKSELDYATEAYYTKGTAGTQDDLVSTQITKIINYVASGNNEPDLDPHYDRAENSSFGSWGETIEGKQAYFSDDAYNNNKNYTAKLLETEQVKLYPEGSGQTSSTDYGIVINKLLSTDAEDLGWQAYSEIIGFNNVTFTPQWEYISGNYNMATLSPDEGDDSNATIAITPSTGADRSYTPYIVIGVSVVVILVGGIILIKKFVLK